MFIASFSFISCGSSTKTTDDYVDESIKITCHKYYTCDEGKPMRDYLGAKESDCVKKMHDAVKESEKEGQKSDTCKEIDQDNADKCMSCLSNLSCADFFAENGQEACDKYCKNACKDGK